MLSGLRFSLIVSTILSSVAPTMGQSGATVYLMGPEDKLKVRVVDWRMGTYDTHEWPALTGEFTVGASGNVSFPIVGDLSAAGKTTAELAESIAVSLRQKVGLAQQPYASVEVIRYRPFYVIGAVGKPGEYPYKPGLTVLQAIGVGGGFERASEASLAGLERELLSSRGEIRVLEAERLQNIVRQARLDAELQDNDIISWPNEIANQAAMPALVKAMKEEEALLEAHRTSLKTQLKSIGQNKGLLADELTSLAAKGVVLARQVGLSKQELTIVSGLVARGLAGTPRQIALQQNEAQLENSRLDLQLTTLRANQDIVRLDRDGAELVAKDHALLLAEKAELRSRLASIDQRMASLQTIVMRAEMRAPFLATSLDGAKLITTYTLTRQVNGETVRKVASETEPVAPGDTLTVEQRREDLRALVSSAR